MTPSDVEDVSSIWKGRWCMKQTQTLLLLLLLLDSALPGVNLETLSAP